MADKYGRAVSERAALDTDPLDVGEVTRLYIESNLDGHEIFHVMSTREALTELDTQHTCTRLNWQQRYKFDNLVAPPTVP